MGNAVHRLDPLAPVDRRVLYWLTDKADEQKTRTVECYRTEIALALGINTRQVARACQKLESRGFLMRTRQKRRDAGNGPNLYTILNPDQVRREKINQVASVSGLPLKDVVEYVYWLWFHKDKLKETIYPTIDDLAQLAHCPLAQAPDFARGLVVAGILVGEREVVF